TGATTGESWSPSRKPSGDSRNDLMEGASAPSISLVGSNLTADEPTDALRGVPLPGRQAEAGRLRPRHRRRRGAGGDQRAPRLGTLRRLLTRHPRGGAQPRLPPALLDPFWRQFGAIIPPR